MINESPYREYFGFSQYIAVTFTLCFILVWSLLPDLEVFKTSQHSVRNDVITFTQELVDLLPSRYWIAVIECIILMGMLFSYLGLLAYNEDILTVPLHDMRTFTDSRANVVQCSSHQEFLDKYAYQETSGVLDLPITEVCKVLYEAQ
ncbi:LANO_0H12552g1_1 [Lachancea nothofagi CBS 11611]|uniref:Phosphatidylinositol N-acetylglucosaminyltransferase subunit GPI19 n=1 Tax=Lachancea nothofagi CBS 11611 TaxID=1266666 RepID=A0A1G4KML9_9SACH|nr:LANO_0H12552g1_1 [Lachancea nothofagi CBS 11611]